MGSTKYRKIERAEDQRGMSYVVLLQNMSEQSCTTSPNSHITEQDRNALFLPSPLTELLLNKYIQLYVPPYWKDSDKRKEMRRQQSQGIQ